MGNTITIQLQEQFFQEREKTLLELEGLSASLFRYENGVCGLRLKNSCGQLVMLPFQGQQIWQCEFGGRDLVMKSMFQHPVPTRDYLSTYGAFLVHCGATAMGVPSKDDTHPLHGELPNALYQKAYLQAGHDEGRAFIALGGQYEHIVAFNYHYVFEPLVKLYADSSVFPVSATLSNLKQTEMEIMYLAHVNFRPSDYGRIVCSAPCTPEHTRVSINVPKHMKSSHSLEEFSAFLNTLKEHPEKHLTLTPDLLLDPEVLFFIDYSADSEGYAHSLHVQPDGYAHFLKHRVAELNKGVRWIARNADQDALGLYLPGTAEHQGYIAEKEKGNLRLLQGGESIEFSLEAGLLTPQAAAQEEKIIADILSAAQ
ncbi:DUF4432 domain-containing protein [candidate division KSB3 bacterium]|uniref:DUF4432 domain-containing protein n=1 Tax=candidate division KSB3 bacterium TaxID=2044937 RepID=A0A2G6E3Z3_9BACT|nr:MAG: DUF4432 domain-containing protein [candidate division KSB3 bacterium]PIE29340.1 MAG: DUF4432 domain-containing protein [candidate division KSB3 bacterium]